MFSIGDRVLMIRHADWKSDAVGTISAGPRERVNWRGETYLDYWIDFDDPQSDYTDEENGDNDRTYKSSTVAGDYIRLLDEGRTSRST
jgi:hypothetical protein